MKKNICFILLAIILASLVITFPVLAYTNDNLTYLTLSGDTFYNYDFSDDAYVGYYNHVDQPATIIFGYGANKAQIKEEYDSEGFAYEGSWQYNSLNDGLGWVDNDDKGVKTDQLDISGIHFRLYAADNDNMHNVTWYYWVLATTHQDMWPYFCYSLGAEDYIVSVADNNLGWTVEEDEWNFYNYDSGEWSGLNYYQCDGWASYVEVP
jgi:hypothetical protein